MMPSARKPPAVDLAGFAEAMQPFGPFEGRPCVAVAVSGGPDSLALLLLTDCWARERNGSVVAFTVDHGLRQDSEAEAKQVAAWAEARAIPHQVLPWIGDKPRSGIQAAARAARYRLLAEACAERGILHLAFAHHADDQAETVLFRKERGSGPAGLAGMAATRSLGAARIIRPLLGWSKNALTETCRRFGQDYIEDPSNSSGRFARTALRRRLSESTELRTSLLRAATAAAQGRIAGEAQLAEALGRIAEIRPDGIVLLNRKALLQAAPETRRAMLAATLRTVGGAEFVPAPDAVSRLEADLAAEGFAGASLAGCIVRGWQDRILVCREPKRVAPALVLEDATWQRWDRRFLVRVTGLAAANEPVTAAALGSQGYARLRRSRDITLPAIAGAGLPAVRCGGRVVSVPPAGWAEGDFPEVEMLYSPLWSLSPETFTVVSARPDIMSV